MGAAASEASVELDRRWSASAEKNRKFCGLEFEGLGVLGFLGFRVCGF